MHARAAARLRPAHLQPVDREVEERLLPLARDRGIAVIVNRPFQQGWLTEGLERPPAPALGGRDRLRELGPAHPQVHRLPPGRDLRHPGDDQGRPCAREHGSGGGSAAGPGDAGADRRPYRGALMGEWLTYSLSDFLLFSPRTYYRLFELYNRAVWPAQLAGPRSRRRDPACSCAAPTPWRAATVAAILAACWLWVAWAYHLERYDSINWAATLLRRRFRGRGAPAGLGRVQAHSENEPDRPRPLPVRPRAPAADRSGPRPAVGTGRALRAGTRSDGGRRRWVWSCSRDGRIRWALLAIPLLWCAVTGLTLWTMGSPDALVTPWPRQCVAALAGLRPTSRPAAGAAG